jgi:hypothetical protein
VDSDLYLAQFALEAIKTAAGKDSSLNFSNEILGKMKALAYSPLLQGGSLQALVNAFVSIGAGG